MSTSETISTKPHLFKLIRAQTARTVFDNILLEVNEMNVLRHWDTAVSVMQDISPEVVYMYKLKIYCRDWREADMKTLAWRAKMYSLTCELIRLKNTV